MTIIICDDDSRDRKILINLLRNYEQEHSERFEIKEYDSGAGLCRDEAALQDCGLVFLDISMEDVDGLQTAVEIKEKKPGLPVVLVSAYMNFVLDGYKVKASRFLLKEDLAETIGECMDDLLADIRKSSRILEFAFVEGKEKLHADDIMYIETSRHKNLFYTVKGTYSIYKKLDELDV